MPFKYTRELIDSGFTYKAYRDELNMQLAEPTADEHAQKMHHYVEKNVELMDGFDKYFKVTEPLKLTLANAPATTWIVITELVRRCCI